MANYLASIFGTEADKVNCSFYYKIGACRHGDRCSRKHVKPSYSQTILLPNLYQNPAYDPKNKMNASQLQNHFDAFYEDFWCEMCKFGETRVFFLFFLGRGVDVRDFWIGLDWIGLDWIGLDWIGLDWIGLDWM